MFCKVKKPTIMTYLIGFLLVLIGCRPSENPSSLQRQDHQPRPIAPAFEVLVNHEILNFPMQFARLGEVRVDRPLDSFVTAPTLAAIQAELQKSIEAPASAAYDFIHCAARFPLPDTDDAAQCDYLLPKTSGTIYEFRFLPYSQERQEVCESLMPADCLTHQAIWVRDGHNGLQRPALFVDKTPLDNHIFLAVRPLLKEKKTIGVFLPGTEFPRDFGTRLAEQLRFGHDFVNLLHLNNKWKEVRDQWIIERNRRYGIGAVIIVSSVFTGGGAAGTLLGSAKLTTFGKIAATLNLSTGITGTAYGFTHARDLEKTLNQLPHGSLAHRTAQITLILAEAAPYLSGASASLNLVNLVATQTAKIHVLAEVASGVNRRISQLHLKTINRVMIGVGNNAIQFTGALQTRNLSKFLQLVTEISNTVTKEILP